MELSIIRAIATGLADPTIGINAMIAGLTLDPGSSDVRPSSVAVYNYVDHPWVARKKLNKDEVEAGHVSLPAAAVYLAQPPVLQPVVRTGFREGDFPIVIAYITIEPDEIKRMRDALYVNRAMLRFLSRFDADTNATMRFRNSVNVYVNKSITQDTPFVPWEAAVLSAATLVTYTCREHSP